MKSMKLTISRLTQVGGLWVLVFFLSLNAQADPGSAEELAAQRYKLTLEQVNAVKTLGSELSEEYSAALKSPDGANKFQATLRKAIADIDAASKPMTINGNKLPESFTDLFFPKRAGDSSGSPNLHIAEMSPGFMGLPTETYLDQYTLIYAGFLINSAPEVLLPILEERAKVFPPTAADYILYTRVLDAFDNNTYSITGDHGTSSEPHPLPLTLSAGLLKLAQAPNPVYRLLAAKAARLVEPDETKRLDFYSAYLNETDPVIQTVAIKGVANTQTPSTTTVLQSFQAAARQNGNAEGADAAQKAIQRLSIK